MFVHQPANDSWLREKWQALVTPLAVDRIAADSAWDTLVRHYSEPHRAYHNLSHIMAMLRYAEAERANIKQPEVVEFAIWFHDVIYDTHAGDNEFRSAEMAHYAMRLMGIGSHIIASVERCILATHKHEVGDSPAADMPLFLDIDLAILGATEHVYRQYSQAIRSEYSWVPQQAYRSGRVETLERFLRRHSLFFTSVMAARFEMQARHNIGLELRELLSS